MAPSARITLSLWTHSGLTMPWAPVRTLLILGPVGCSIKICAKSARARGDFEKIPFSTDFDVDNLPRSLKHDLNRRLRRRFGQLFRCGTLYGRTCGRRVRGRPGRRRHLRGHRPLLRMSGPNAESQKQGARCKQNIVSQTWLYHDRINLIPTIIVRQEPLRLALSKACVPHRFRPCYLACHHPKIGLSAFSPISFYRF
jgi:hypothetical protein